MADDILIGDTPKARRRRSRLAALRPAGRLWKHSTLADVDGILTRDEAAAFFVFTMVRNPWDRMVSLYAWARAQKFDHPVVRAARAGSFAEFLDDGAIAAAVRAGPARVYTTDASGVDRARAVLRLECLARDLDPLAAHLGFRPELAHLNRSERRPGYRDYFDARSRARVAELCAEDIARFGYAF